MAGLVRVRILPVVVILAGAAGLSCGGDDNSGTPPSTTAIAKTSGDGQEGRVGQTLVDPLEVTVTDGGAPAAGETVTWSVTAGGGVLDLTSVATDADGHATASWTLGPLAGPQAAQASLAGAAGSPLIFTATGVVGEAASLAEAGGNGQSAAVGTPLPSPLQAKVADEFGNGVPGVAVGWTATGGTVSAPSVTSDATGISAVNVTAGAAPGPITIVATADGLSGSPLTFTATAGTAPTVPTTASVQVGNIFFKSGRNSTSNPAVDTVAVGGTVTWSWVGGLHSVLSSGSPSFTSSSTQSSGTYPVTFSTAGTYQYTCSVHPGQMTGRIVVR
jgi:plastocyanin